MKFFTAIPLALALFTATTSALPVARSTNYARDAPSDALEARTRFNILPFQQQRPPAFPRPAIFAPGRPFGGRPIFRPAVQPSRRSEVDDLAAILDELAAAEPGSIEARDIQARFIGNIFNKIKSLLFGRDLNDSVEARDLQARFIGNIFNKIKSLLFGRDLQDDELTAILEELAAAEPGSVEARDVQARFIGNIFNKIKSLLFGRDLNNSVEARDVQARFIGNIFNKIKSLLFGRDLNDDVLNELLSELATEDGTVQARDVEARFIGNIFNKIKSLLFGRDLEDDELTALLTELAAAEPGSVEARDVQARFIGNIFNKIKSLLFGRDSGAADISARDLEARFFFIPAIAKALGLF